MFKRIVKSLVFKNKLLYSTQEKKNVVVVPKRYEVSFDQFEQLNSFIITSESCKILSVLLKVIDLVVRKMLSFLLIIISRLCSSILLNMIYQLMIIFTQSSLLLQFNGSKPLIETTHQP